MAQARNVMKSLKIKDFLQMDGKIIGNGLLPLSKDKIWYVWEKKDSATTGSGHSWDDAFLTMTEALTAAGDNDYIMVGPGSYKEGALTITQDYLTIIGTNTNNNMYEAYINGSTVASLFILKADKFRVYNLGFVQSGAAPCITIGDTDGLAYYQALIDGCKFEGGTFGIVSGGTPDAAGNVDAPDITIQNCHFRSQTDTSIKMNWTRAVVRNNSIIVDAGNNGIEIMETTGSRPDALIYENYITGVDSTDVGIAITNSPTAGTFKIMNNYIVGCATSITTGKGGDEDFLYNHVSNATGGEIFDPSP